MKRAVVGRKRRRDPLLRCHIVDDHCDALSKIHAAIRTGALPFTGLSVLHFDAHPDLMVTPDMPASTCFRPRELYNTLATAEGGIAEWILPMVYQGHLSEIWWIRPPWARQISDGHHDFCVGQVKASGKLRVSSTAPYFVDDRLYCNEENMQECKPVHLYVSLLPEAQLSPMEPRNRDVALPAHTPRARVEVDTADKGAESRVKAPSGGFVTSEELEDVFNVVDGPAPASLSGATSVRQQPAKACDSNEDVQPTPWVLDICLDFFTTENPFMEELESHIGTRDAAVVRDFYEKPRFRGAATSLPHSTQLEHERIFRMEVNKLLDLTSMDEVESTGFESAAAEVPSSAAIGVLGSTTAVSADSRRGCGVGSTRCPGEEVTDCLLPPFSSTEDEGKEGEAIDRREDSRSLQADGVRRLQRLEQLFDTNGGERQLVGKFASIVGSLDREGREKVAWTDHCACLPRHLATCEEIKASLRKMEAFLLSLLSGEELATEGGSGRVSGGSSVCWKGRPGVITVARSEGDGYVPTEMVALVEREVLEMLTRLYGNADNSQPEGSSAGGIGLEVCYEEGLEPIPIPPCST